MTQPHLKVNSNTIIDGWSDILMKLKWFVFFLCIIVVSSITYSFFGEKESTTTKIGVLMVGESRYEKFFGLSKGLQDIGFKETELQFIVKNAHENADKLPVLINSLLNEDPGIIVTLGGIETVRLKTELEKKNIHIPVVFAGVAAPKEVGLIDDFRQPGGMFTGINNYHTIISGKRLELFTELVPNIKRVFVIYDETIDLSLLSLAETRKAAQKLKIEIIPIDMNDPNYKNKIEQNSQMGDGLLILPSYKIEARTEELVEITKENKLPSMALYQHEVENGFLAGHGASFYEQGYQAARYVSAIIQGNSPSEMPVELPDEIRFMVNKEVSDQLGITLNSDWLFNAEIVPLKKEAEGGE